MSEAAAVAKPSGLMLVPNRFGHAEHVRNHWVATVEVGPNGADPSDFLKPEYWSLIAKSLQPYDLIEVRADDGSYWGEFLVRQCDRNWAKVHPLREHKFGAEEKVAADQGDFEVVWKGPHKKWCVIRRNDSSMVHEGEQEKLGAITWLEGYAKQVGQKAA